MSIPEPKLAIVWDVQSKDRNFEEVYFLVFDSSVNGNGPFGLLLCARRQSSLSEKQFQRIGYIQGYRAARQLCRWGSAGWDSGGDSSDDTIVPGSPSGKVGQAVMEDQVKTEWLKTILEGETTTLMIF